MTVEKVDGRDEFIKKLAAVNPQMEALLKKILTDEALKEMTDPTSGVTPTEPKAVNEHVGEEDHPLASGRSAPTTGPSSTPTRARTRRRRTSTGSR